MSAHGPNHPFQTGLMIRLASSPTPVGIDYCIKIVFHVNCWSRESWKQHARLIGSAISIVWMLAARNVIEDYLDRLPTAARKKCFVEIDRKKMEHTFFWIIDSLSSVNDLLDWILIVSYYEVVSERRTDKKYLGRITYWCSLWISSHYLRFRLRWY